MPRYAAGKARPHVASSLYSYIYRESVGIRQCSLAVGIHRRVYERESEKLINSLNSRSKTRLSPSLNVPSPTSDGRLNEAQLSKSHASCHANVPIHIITVRHSVDIKFPI